MGKDTNQTSMTKVIAITVLSILGLVLLSSTFFNNNPGYMGHKGMHGMGQTAGSPLYGFLGGLIGSAIHLIWVFVIVMLIATLAVIVKRGFGTRTKVYPSSVKTEDCPNCGKGITDQFKFCPSCTTRLLEKCHRCQNNIQWSWQCCPYCGERKEEKN